MPEEVQNDKKRFELLFEPSLYKRLECRSEQTGAPISEIIRRYVERGLDLENGRVKPNA